MIYTFILGVIPARGGSKGIIRKNLYPLNGRPLIDYTIDAAFRSKLDDFIISTDDKEIAQLGNAMMRPKGLAQDDTPMLPVIQHVVRQYENKHKSIKVDAVMILQPTSPLRTHEDIDRCMEIFKANMCDSLVSVFEGIHHLKSYDQDGNPYLSQVPYDKRKYKCYTRNGAIFLLSRKLLDSGKLYSEKPFLYTMPRSRSIDIDHMDDMVMAEALFKYGGDRK